MARGGAGSCCGSVGSFLISYNSVRVLEIKHVKLGVTNRLIQLLIFIYAVWSLFVNRQYMKIEPAAGAQDIFADKHPSTLTSAPEYCDNAKFNYYFSKFWHYADIGCRDLEMAEMVIPDTTSIMVITAVEEKTINRTACSAIGQCTKDIKVNSFFTVDPENTVQVLFHHSYKTTWGETGFDIPAKLVSGDDGSVIGTVEAGHPAAFFLKDYLKAAGVSTMDQQATFGGNATATEQPRYRLIGVNLGVELEYTNINGAVLDHTVELTIKVFNLDNGWAQVIRPPQYKEVPNQVYSQLVQGARLQFTVVGQIGRVDGVAIVGWLVNTVVLLGISRVIVDFLAFNLLGEQSTVYKQSKTRVLNKETELMATGGDDSSNTRHRLNPLTSSAVHA